MGKITMETNAYAKIVLHATKYPHCAVNGVLLAEAGRLRDGTKVVDLDIVDTVPLFHHSHNLSPMAEIALSQIETIAQDNKRMIVGYYAACENFNDNTVEKCPGQKIAEKIAEYFPSAVFLVLDNKKMDWVEWMAKDATPVDLLKVHRLSEGKWKLQPDTFITFQTPYAREAIPQLVRSSVQNDLVDFDNYLDDPSMDWTNLALEKLIASMDASNLVEYDD